MVSAFKGPIWPGWPSWEKTYQNKRFKRIDRILRAADLAIPSLIFHRFMKETAPLIQNYVYSPAKYEQREALDRCETTFSVHWLLFLGRELT